MRTKKVRYCEKRQFLPELPNKIKYKDGVVP